MNGGQLAGGNPIRGRVENDFYATPEVATQAILAVEDIIYPALEPACGAGHISKLLRGETISCDLVDRGYSNITLDFLSDLTSVRNRIGTDNIQTVITNPPFNLFQEFAIRSLEIAHKK